MKGWLSRRDPTGKRRVFDEIPSACGTCTGYLHPPLVQKGGRGLICELGWWEAAPTSRLPDGLELRAGAGAGLAQSSPPAPSEARGGPAAVGSVLQLKVGCGSPCAAQKQPRVPAGLQPERSPGAPRSKSRGNSAGFALAEACGVTVNISRKFVVVAISFTCIY